MKSKPLFYLLFIVVGALSGYLYYELYGCTRGCAITSVWYHSSAYGGVMGFLAAGMLKDHFMKPAEKEHHETQ